MKLLDLTLASPEDNLACDEALLNWAEAGGGEVLRFWEPREYFVVVGYADRVETEVNVATCANRNIPIFRRCSGGGTVLQGPGCLNYTLVLRVGTHPSLANISCTNRFIMERNREAVESSVRRLKPEAKILVCGHTDLALVTSHPLATPNPCEGGSRPTLKKFSGNSQRRHKNCALFHGTFLLNFNIPLINELLRMPSKQPDYRHQRSHSDFLTNLNLTPSEVKAAMHAVWKATSMLEEPPNLQISKLSHEKYDTKEWNYKL